MQGATDHAVEIGNGHSGVTLIRAGSRSEVGFPTRIDVVAGPFRGTVRDDTVGSYERFHGELRNLYQSLSGTARLGSLEGFALVLTAGTLGTISVNVTAIGSHVPSIRLIFEFDFDQTYLPPIIAGIEREFLDACHDASSRSGVIL